MSKEPGYHFANASKMVATNPTIMKITHTITIKESDIEETLWQGAIEAAKDFVSELNGNKRHDFTWQRDRKNRRVVIIRQGKVKASINVPSPEDVEQDENGKLRVRLKPNTVEKHGEI